MTVLIPAYEPDIRLIELVERLHEHCDYRIIVVDDGSGSNYQQIFNALRNNDCIILTHERNMGKGRALKTGFSYILNEAKEKTGVVTADADGQHTVLDIIRVAEEISLTPGKIVLGARKFVGKVPFRSAFGNIFTRCLFTFASGKRVWDTQTGLRGIPVSLLPTMISLSGERFEYEMNMLLEAGNLGYGFNQLFIDTIYIAGNKSSHFHPVSDSIRVCIPFFKFCMSSFTAAIVDYVLLFVFQAMTHSLFFAVVAARAASSGVNYTINRTMVFRSHTSLKPQNTKAFNYYVLVCILLIFNYLLLSFFSEVLGIWLFWSKIITEILLFFISYTVQRFFLFKKTAVY